MLPAAPRASDIFNDGLLVRPLMYDLRDACGRAVSLPAVDAYAGVAPTATSAQGQRNRRATCECAESCACGGCICSQSFATDAQESQSTKVGAILGSGLEADLLTRPSWLLI